MDKNFRSRLQRAIKDGRIPDMRKPQSASGYVPPPEGVALARFIGYFEVGEHQTTCNGVVSYANRARLVFELSGEGYPPREVEGVATPHVVSVETDLSLLPGDRFFETFARMNFGGSASHMAQLLGEPFLVAIGHRRRTDGTGIYATIEAHQGYLIYPAKRRDAITGEILVADTAQGHYEIRAFVWDAADLDDWYSIYIPGEWPEQRDSTTGEVIQPAKTKHVLQERIAAARNWPQHPLAAVAKFGGDPRQPTPEELERLQREELKARQEEIRRYSNEALDATWANYRKSRKRKPRKGRSA